MWLCADRWRRHWVPNVFADRRVMLAVAVASVVPFAIDGHAQSDVFMALAPLAGIAAVACRRREVAIFTALWLAAYLLGTMAGGGLAALVAGTHRFDAAMQTVFILSCCSMSAFAVVRYRRFVDQIPARIAEGRAAEDSAHASTQAATNTSADSRPRRGPAVGEPLTVGEEEVLSLLAGDHTRGDIALRLGLGDEGVKARIASAMKKYGVRSQYAAVARFVGEGGRRA
jgi:DNA-binding CsgD family transcriptional regulator